MTGLLDIFVSKGNLEQMPDFAAYDPSNLLLGQWNGKFAEAGDEAGIACNAKGRGALIADFNLDGRLDILQINRGSNALLYRNLGAKNGDGPPLPMGNWSEIRLIEPNPNRNAVGARIYDQDGNAHARPASSTWAAATPPAMRASSMSASARPSEQKSGCNGLTATRAPPTACSPTSSWSSTAPSRRPHTGTRRGRASSGRSLNEAPTSARHDLVHLHDHFNLRVVGDVAHDLRAMLGERGLKFVAGIEFEIGDGEIWRLAASGIRHSFVEFATHQPFRP